jgi:hypothetical protein
MIARENVVFWYRHSQVRILAPQPVSPCKSRAFQRRQSGKLRTERNVRRTPAGTIVPESFHRYSPSPLTSSHRQGEGR